MTILTVRHVTVYRYRVPVGFGDHRMMFRPRDGHDQKVLEEALTIDSRTDENTLAARRFW